ncbi:MAG: FHA domain-containing protein [Acidobacteria bacterium]|nr:FHA domain-containing protein [Acidobacteriota bacterium]
MLAQDAVLHDRYRIAGFSGLTRTARSYDAIDGRFGTRVVVRECERSKPRPFREAFVREARILNGCQHVALPVVTDAFAAGDAFYLVERKIPSESVANLLERDRKPFAPVLVLSWLDAILDLLEYLHSLPAPIIVANISPASIEISSRGSVFLTDFSVAIEGPGKTLAWTYPYAPIEQMEGQDVDVRADVHALAASAYEMLLGVRPLSPHEREQTKGGVAFDPLEHFARVVSRPLAAVLDRAMSLRPESRQPTATELRLELVTAGTTTVPVAKLPSSVDAPPQSPIASDAAFGSFAHQPTAPVESLVPASGKTTIICRTCGSTNEATRVFCPHCGSLLRSDRRPGTLDVAALLPDFVPLHELSPTAPVVRPAAPDTVVDRLQETFSADLVSPPVVQPVQHSPEPARPVSPFAGRAEVRRGSDPLRTAEGGPNSGDPTMPLARLLVLEGEEPGRMLLIRAKVTTLGRSAGDYIFRQDAFMSGRHAKVKYVDDCYRLDDAGSRNGTFMRIRKEARLAENDIVLAGQQLLRFEHDAVSREPQLRLQLNNGDAAATYDLARAVTAIGRTQGEIRFADDAAMADMHARIERRGDDCFVVDGGSRNGTFLRLTTDRPLSDGDVFIIGRHIFKFEADVSLDDQITEDL